MTPNERLSEATLHHWMDEGTDLAPERAVHAALTQIATTRQRRELALLRRIPLMNTRSRTLNRAPMPIAMVAVVGVLVLLGVGVLARQVLPSIGSEAPAASDIVVGLPTPTDSRLADRSTGVGALTDLFAATRVMAFRNLAGYGDAWAVSYVGLSDDRGYTAAVIRFADAISASRAVATLEAGVDQATGTAMDVSLWSTTPWLDAHLPESIDEGFARGGTYWAFGDTSAGDAARVGLLLVARIESLVLVSVGADWEVRGTGDYQASIETGVIGLAEELVGRVR